DAPAPPDPIWPTKLKPMPNPPGEESTSFASDDEALAPTPTRAPTSSFACDCGGEGGMNACGEGGLLGGCDDACCAPAYRRCRWYGSAEALLWWTKGDSAPPLVTTSSVSSAGILGNPDTL